MRDRNLQPFDIRRGSLDENIETRGSMFPCRFHRRTSGVGKRVREANPFEIYDRCTGTEQRPQVSRRERYRGCPGLGKLICPGKCGTCRLKRAALLVFELFNENLRENEETSDPDNPFSPARHHWTRDNKTHAELLSEADAMLCIHSDEGKSMNEPPVHPATVAIVHCLCENDFAAVSCSTCVMAVVRLSTLTFLCVERVAALHWFELFTLTICSAVTPS